MSAADEKSDNEMVFAEAIGSSVLGLSSVFDDATESVSSPKRSKSTVSDDLRDSDSVDLSECILELDNSLMSVSHMVFKRCWESTF